jgi:predicted metal-binding protein
MAIYETIKVDPVIDMKVRGLCVRPYPGHKRGCPNFGKYPDCPPAAPKFFDYFDEAEPVYAIVHEFNLAGHRERMLEKHPKWSIAQAECCLYWQGKARRMLQEGISYFLEEEHPGYEVTIRPEAMGVNVTETLRRAGIELEWPPKNIVRQVALAGIRRA